MYGFKKAKVLFKHKYVLFQYGIRNIEKFNDKENVRRKTYEYFPQKNLHQSKIEILLKLKLIERLDFPNALRASFFLLLQKAFSNNKPENPFQNYELAKKYQKNKRNFYV